MRNNKQRSKAMRPSIRNENGANKRETKHACIQMIKYLCKSEDTLISRWVVSLIRWQSTSSNGNALAHVFWESIYNPTEMK